MTNKPRGTLYVGVTSELQQRVWQHKHNKIKGFTSKYQLHTLVYYETGGEIYAAITREKQIKHWKREWRIQLIESKNPEWRDLYPDICG